jgi:4-diphosphocytidyl-2-C-methyl-D-erythritol kinase
MGAGLGGGSSNGAVFVNLVDEKFKLGMSLLQKTEIADVLGSDCSFFIDQKPVYAEGKGNVFEPINLNLAKYFILLVFPSIQSNTKLAYSGVTPKKPQHSIKKIIAEDPIEKWKDVLVNDFENSVLKAFPEIGEIKQNLYANGAIYASMSGSGSTVFGIFNEKPSIKFPPHYKVHLQDASSKNRLSL